MKKYLQCEQKVAIPTLCLA